ncbi:MAG TPA: hypothetical protein VIK70_11395, partial [Lysobacter sp.]
MSCKHNHLALAIGALLYAGIANPSLAQTTETPATAPAAAAPSATTLDKVTVTGSHIKRAAISGVGPVTVIDRESIQRSGATSVETLLQRMPASAGFGGNQTNAYWADNG